MNNSVTQLHQSKEKVRIAFVGLGQQTMSDYLPAISNSPLYEIVGGADLCQDRCKQFSETCGQPAFQKLEQLIASKQIDAAFLALPHCEYFQAMTYLIRNGIHIIKEKPFSLTLEESKIIESLSRNYKTKILVTLQRRYNPVYQNARKLLEEIGHIYMYRAEYTLDIDRLDTGWRALKQFAGGGAVIDMGYHLIDLIEWFIGKPSEIFARTSSGNKLDQIYDVEDTALLSLKHDRSHNSSHQVLGQILISRVGKQKREFMEIVGTNGRVEITPSFVRSFCSQDLLEKTISLKDNKPAVLKNILDDFYFRLREPKQPKQGHFHQTQMEIIDASYKSANFGNNIVLSKI